MSCAHASWFIYGLLLKPETALVSFGNWRVFVSMWEISPIDSDGKTGDVSGRFSTGIK